MGKMGQAPNFCRDELFFSSTVLRDEFAIAIVHDPLLVLHQLWNEVTEAVGRVPRESEAFAAEP